eukprot:4197548-Alexandrium_andersonii.AAC.1
MCCARAPLHIISSLTPWPVQVAVQVAPLAWLGRLAYSLCAWCGVAWGGVVWRGVVWCGVV